MSAGLDAVVKMYERARFTSRSVKRVGPATNPPSAPEGLRECADAQCVDAVEVDVGTEHGVSLVEHQQRAVVRAHRRELVDRRDVAVHGEHGLAHHDGARRWSRRGGSRRRGRRRSGGRPRAARRRVGDRRSPTRGSARRSTPARRVLRARRARRGWRRSRWRTTPPTPRPSTRRAHVSSSACTGRAPTMSRAEPAPVPQRSMASCAAATTAGWWVSPR